MAKVYFYGRNSDVEAAEKGSSLETQKGKAEAYAKLKDLTINEYFYDQISGTIPIERREQGFVLVKSLKSGDHLITSTDRLGRNTINILTFIEKCKKQKINVHLIDIGGEVTGGDMISTMFVRLLAVFNQFYADQLSEKQKATKQRMKKENRFLGGKAKYGFDVDNEGKYIVCEKEMSVIRQMKLLKDQGHTYRSIAREVSRSTNKKFDSGWIYRILQRDNRELLV
jgi:DNA invertase Pin-like site-specific DNA recombinase